jgi:hypothetical protein
MSDTTFTYREGTTEPITITLYNNDVAADISGYTKVSIFLRSADGGTQSEAATTDNGVVVTTAASGVITFHPSKLTTALVYSKGAYYGYIIVEDSASKRTSFPSNGNFVFEMLERYSGDG